MDIKKKQKINFLDFLQNRLKSRTKWILRWFLSGFLFLTITVLFFIAGVQASRTGFLRQQIIPALRGLHSAPVHYVKSLFTRPNRITLDIKNNDFQKLSYNKEVAVQNGFLLESEKEFIPATLTFNNKKYEVKIRLTGFLKDHFNSDKWSLRIKVKNDEAVMGMKEFNLLNPITRNGIYEWTAHELEKLEGLISLRTDFVELVINGNNKGIYLLEENFDTTLIENNSLREGIIFQPTVPIKIYQEDDLLQDPEKRRQMTLLKELFDSFLNGDLKMGDLFDVEKMAKFYAITDLTVGFHQLWLGNMHLYFNPITGKVEPIGREYGINPESPGIFISAELDNAGGSLYDNYFQKNMFEDSYFFESYIKNLVRMSSQAYLDNFFSSISHDLLNKLSIIYRDYPTLNFAKDYFYKNQDFIKKRIDPELRDAGDLKGNSSWIKAYYTSGSSQVTIQNFDFLPVEIISIQINNTVSTAKEKIIILPGRDKNPQDGVNVSFSDFSIIGHPKDEDTLRLNYRILGMNFENSIAILPWILGHTRPLVFDLTRQRSNVEEFNFFHVDKFNKKIYVKTGTWIVNRDIVIPPGFTVFAFGGTRINLTGSSSILSQSPLFFKGLSEQPIYISSVDKTNNGMVLIGTQAESFFENVYFENLSNPSQKGWNLTGAVTFYESPVQISECKFSSNRSEDSINIIRSKFVIQNSIFTDTGGDAIDVDFGNGRVVESYFFKIGNDAVDVSGTFLDLTNIRVNGAGDKGLSAGEGSTVSAEGLEFRNVRLGLASKDSSRVKVKNITIKNSQIGYAVFQKKTQYGPASVEIIGSDITDNVVTPFLLEATSSLIIDRQKIQPNSDKIKDVLYE